MEIWAWVHQRTDQLRDMGQDRLADIIEEIPTAANESRHDAVEALVPEGLALARSLKDAWVEVFLRHWLLQSRVLHRHDVSDGLQGAVEALDFAHNDNTKDCPQSVCTVQDICAAQGIVDGPGHVDDRLAICTETLARIDPSWPCFGCISAEQASALVDGERWSELDAFCRTQVARADDASDVFALNHALARSLIRQGRYDEARAIVDGTAVFGRRGARQRDQQLLEAWLACATGDLAQAHAKLPDIDTLDGSDIGSWTEVALGLARQGALDNTAAMGRALREHTLTLCRHDSRHATAMMLVHGAELALLRGQPAIARLNIVDAQAARERVKRKDIVDGALELVRQQLVAVERDHVVVPFDLDIGLQAQLDRREPETAIARLTATMSLVADDAVAAQVATELAAAYAAAGFAEHAERVVASARERFPHQLDLLQTQLVLWRQRGDENALRASLSVPFPERRLVLLELALLDEDRGRFAAAAETIAAITDTNATDVDAADIHARVLRSANDHHAALVVIARTIAALGERADAPEARALHWERSLCATLVDDHDTARAAAAALGFVFEGTGPIDEPIAWCRIRSVDDKGRSVERVAVRNGPVTARITARLEAKLPPVYGDIVVFVPAPVGESAGPPDEEGRLQRVFTYPALRVLKPGLARSFDLDGFHPGDAAIEALMAAVAPHASISRHSDPGYRLPLLAGMPAHVVNDDDDDVDIDVVDVVDDEEAAHSDDLLTRPGLYLALLVPEPTTPLAPLLEIVLQQLATWPRPMTCRSLLAAVHGTDDARVIQQQALADALQL